MIGTLARKGRAAVDVLVAIPAVLEARRRVVNRPVGELVGKTELVPPESGAGTQPESERQCGARWGAAVDRAFRLLPGDSSCLVRAGALQAIVVGRGLPRAEVRIGVRRGANGFEAHAWVEQDGIPIAESATLRGAFSSLDGVTLR